MITIQIQKRVVLKGKFIYPKN